MNNFIQKHVKHNSQMKTPYIIKNKAHLANRGKKGKVLSYNPRRWVTRGKGEYTQIV